MHFPIVGVANRLSQVMYQFPADRCVPQLQARLVSADGQPFLEKGATEGPSRKKANGEGVRSSSPTSLAQMCEI